MKLIKAIIRPEALPAVKKELIKHEIHKMTVVDVRGCGEQGGYKQEYRGVIEEVTLIRKVQLEIAVNDNFVESTINALLKAARTGKIGDGKIFILPLEECIRIRTGEKGSKAIG